MMTSSFFHLYTLAMVSAASVLAIAGLLVLVSRNRSVYARLWVVAMLLAAVTWVSMHLVSHVVESQSAALILSRLAFATGPTGCLAFFCFGLAFLQKLRRWRRVIQISIALDVVLVVLSWSTNLLFTDLRDYGLGLRFPAAGPLIPLYGALELLWLACPPVLFFSAWKHARGRMRLQLGYLSVAILCMALAAAGTLAPIMGRESLLALLPMLGMVAGPALITYAIIRHQLWDIRSVAHKTALWLAASSLIVVPVYLGVHIAAERGLPGRLALPAALLLFVVFGLHFRVVQPWINHRFGRGTRNLEKVLGQFNREVQNLRGVEDLSKLLSTTLQSAVYTTQVCLKVAVGDDRPPDDRMTPELERLLTRLDGEIDASALEHLDLQPGEEAALAAFLRAQQAAVLAPLVHEGRLLGSVVLGEKANLRAYTREDFILLERIRPLAAIALANALLYDRLQELNTSLEQRVEQRTRELSEANRKLLELDRVKTKFFANITHELRTPLTLILAPLEDLLLRGGGELAEDLATMHRNALRLLRQINALLTLAKLDAGALRLRPVPMNLNQLVEAAVRNFRPIAGRKGVTLNFVPLEGDDSMSGDPDKLDLVLGNLIANGVKFTDPGGSVQVRALTEESGLAVAVKDTGIGIPEDELERIFDRFAQVDSGPTRRYEGAGIGLALVREIVTLHRGSIAVSSTLGQGSEFRVRLPRRLESLPDSVLDRRQVDLPTAERRRAEDTDPGFPFALDGEAWISIQRDTAAPRGEGPFRVLLVEDNPDMRSYLQRRLADHFQVAACCNGREALAVVADRAPDLIVADVMMPEMSGEDLCRHLKREAATAAIPIILITARKGTDRALEGFRCGADDYLTKPFNFQELLARVRVQLRLADMARQLARQEKGAVLNLVAAGLAHEVRNPVNAILNAVSPLRRLQDRPADQDTEGARAELLQAIQESAQRIDVLVGDVLEVSRSQVDETSSWSLPEAVESTARLLRCKYGRPVNLECSFACAEKVFGRTAELNQVLLNVLDNAVRAAGPGGAVWISTERAGDTIRLRVRDNGPGVPEPLRERIFDPFFSTHGGKGSTGLGLYISRRIVEEHGGELELRSPEGGGAELVIELPLSPAPEEQP